MDLVSPQPFWPLRNGLLSVYPSLKRDVACDVVVLGGGISGAFVAEALTREGLDVVVVDKREVGGGSTSASTALLQYEIDTPLIELSRKIGRRDAEQSYRLCHDSIDSIERLVEDLKVECALQRRKSVYLATRSSDAEMLRKECVARQGIGIDVEYWDEPEVAARFSFSRPAALQSSQAVQLDCHRLTHALLARAATSGASIFDRTLVDQYDAGADGVRLRTDRGCQIRADHAVVATGYEAQEFLPKRVVKLKSTYALASEPLEMFPGWWERCLIWETGPTFTFARRTMTAHSLAAKMTHFAIQRDEIAWLLEKPTSLQRASTRCFQLLSSKSPTAGRAHSARPRMVSRSSGRFDRCRDVISPWASAATALSTA
jgi:glycine/D-amino acid oxidase-like deaminating enzyme